MDAQPQRPFRALRAPIDENCAPVSCNKQNLHPRNKSSSNIALLTVGGFKYGAKRTAFGDVSNTAKNLPKLQEDPGHEQKNLVKCPELHENSAPMLKQPHRSQSVGPIKIKKPASQSSIPEVNRVAPIPKKNHLRPNLPVKRSLSARTTTIYKDLDAKKVSNTYSQAPWPDSVHSAIPNYDQQRIKEKASQVCCNQINQNYNNLPIEVKQEKLPNDRRSYDESEKLLAVPDEDTYKKENSHNNHISKLANVSSQEFRNNAPHESCLPPIISEAEEYLEEEEEEEDDDEEEEESYEDQGHLTMLSYRSNGDNTTGGATTLLYPKITKKILLEIESARRYTEKHRTLEDIGDEMWDTSMVAEYGDDIFSHMRELEIKMLPNAHYMDFQTDIQWSMRSVLMDWLIQVHHRLSLLPETLFLCVNYVDRFLSHKIVSLGKLQLVGATAIFIAAKYEEIDCPSVNEIVYMVDGGYSIDEILKAERFMLNMLQFELGWPGPMSFLRRISKADEYDLESRTLAKYFLEVTLMDERFVGNPPSYIAAGSHCLARLMLRKGDWSKKHIHYSGYTWTQLRPLVALVRECCENPEKHHNAVYQKYSDRRFKRAAQFVRAEIRNFALPPIQPYRPSLPSNETVFAHGLYEKKDSLRRTVKY